MYFFENQDETRDFLTFYKKDISLARRASRRLKARSFAPDSFILNSPIADSYKEYLYTKNMNDVLPLCYRSESLEENFKKLIKKYPHLKKTLLKKPPDEEIIEKDKRKFLSSVYQLSYGEITGEDKIYYDLPTNYSVPETASQSYYKNPRYFGDPKVVDIKKVKQKDCISINNTERKILRIRTGDSEYQDSINKVGDRIINEQFFGPPLPIDPPKAQIKNQSICEQISMQSANRLKISQIM